jgi:hypothetical protein
LQFRSGKDPVLFSDIQDFAKSCADKNVLRIVLVFSDGALPLMLASSAASRADLLFEVGEISDADAYAYLLSRGVHTVRAGELVRTLTGGNFPLLHKYGNAERTLPEIRRLLFGQTAITLLDLGISSDHALFSNICENEAIQSNDALRMMPRVLFDGLLKLNILAVHCNGTCTFHNRHVTAFMISEREGRKVNVSFET